MVKLHRRQLEGIDYAGCATIDSPSAFYVWFDERSECYRGLFPPQPIVRRPATNVIEAPVETTDQPLTTPEPVPVKKLDRKPTKRCGCSRNR